MISTHLSLAQWNAFYGIRKESYLMILNLTMAAFGMDALCSLIISRVHMRRVSRSLTQKARTTHQKRALFSQGLLPSRRDMLI